MNPRQEIPSDDSRGKTGSPPSGEPDFLLVGKLQRVHGLRGEIVMEVMTDFPERLQPGKFLYVGNEHKQIKIQSVRRMHENLLISFDGFENRDLAQILRNSFVFVRTDQLPKLPAGEYYHHQILGMMIEDSSGATLGKLVDILETPANDVYIIEGVDGKEILLAAVESVIVKVDLERQVIVVNPPEWE